MEVVRDFRGGGFDNWQIPKVSVFRNILQTTKGFPFKLEKKKLILG